MARSFGVALAASLSLSSFALASPSAKLVFVRGDGASTCPGETELRKAVAARLGYDPFFPAAHKTVVTEVQGDGRGFRGKLRIVAPDGTVLGQRELATRGEDCSQLVLALALAVSIALDDLDELAPEPAPEPEAAPPPVVEPEAEHRAPAQASARSVAPPPPPRSPRFGLSASLGPTVALGTAPAPAPGASLSTSLRRGAFSVRLDARAELPAGHGLEPRGRVTTQSLVAALSACLHGVVPFVCAGAGGGTLVSRTSGIREPATDAAGLVLFGARGGARIPLGTRFYFEPSLEIGIHGLRRVVEVDAAPVYRAPPVWGVLALQVGAKIF